MSNSRHRRTDLYPITTLEAPFSAVSSGLPYVRGVPPDPITVRPAQAVDIDALVELRLENGRVHVALDPVVYRVPDSDVVRQHFARKLADGSACSWPQAAAVR
jgi:hypothetical protein